MYPFVLPIVIFTAGIASINRTLEVIVPQSLLSTRTLIALFSRRINYSSANDGRVIVRLSRCSSQKKNVKNKLRARLAPY